MNTQKWLLKDTKKEASTDDHKQMPMQRHSRVYVSRMSLSEPKKKEGNKTKLIFMMNEQLIRRDAFRCGEKKFISLFCFSRLKLLIFKCRPVRGENNSIEISFTFVATHPNAIA